MWTYTPKPEPANATMATLVDFAVRLHQLTALGSGRRAMRTAPTKHTQSQRTVQGPVRRALRLMVIVLRVLLAKERAQDAAKTLTVQTRLEYLAAGSDTENGCCNLGSLSAKMLRTTLDTYGTLRSLLSAWILTTTPSCMDPTVPRANLSALEFRAAAHVVMTARVAVQGQKRIARLFAECSQVTDGESRKQPGVPTQVAYWYQG